MVSFVPISSGIQSNLLVEIDDGRNKNWTEIYGSLVNLYLIVFIMHILQHQPFVWDDDDENQCSKKFTQDVCLLNWLADFKACANMKFSRLKQVSVLYVVLTKSNSKSKTKGDQGPRTAAKYFVPELQHGPRKV